MAQKIGVVLERQKMEIPGVDDVSFHEVWRRIAEVQDFRLGMTVYRLKMEPAQAVADRTKKLEEELLQLQCQLIAARNKSESNCGESGLKTKFWGLESEERKKLVELEAIKKEKDLLIDDLASHVAKLCERELGVRVLEKELDGMRALMICVIEARIIKIYKLFKFMDAKLKDIDREIRTKILEKDNKK